MESSITSCANNTSSIAPATHFSRNDNGSAGVDVDVVLDEVDDVAGVEASVVALAVSVVATTAHHGWLSSGHAHTALPPACGLHSLFEGQAARLSLAHAGADLASQLALLAEPSAVAQTTDVALFWPSLPTVARARQNVQLATSVTIPAAAAAAFAPTIVTDAPSACTLMVGYTSFEPFTLAASSGHVRVTSAKTAAMTS